jgi:hypothetical protein
VAFGRLHEQDTGHPRRVIHFVVDSPDPPWTCCGEPHPHQISLSCVRVIMTLMHVHRIMEPLCLTATKQILALKKCFSVFPQKRGHEVT